jgi:hypothetical protein
VLPARVPDGSPFGFNVHHEPSRAWIVVGEDVDVEPLVGATQARPGGDVQLPLCYTPGSAGWGTFRAGPVLGTAQDGGVVRERVPD